MHTGIKELQVHPLIRFWLQSRVDEKCGDLHKSLSSFICSCLASRCSQRSPSQQRYPWALQLKEQILNSVSSWLWLLLSADDRHDRCLQCQGLQHAEDAFVDDSCACCGRMSMTSLRSHLSFLKGLVPSAATRPGSLWLEQSLSGLSRLALWEI